MTHRYRWEIDGLRAIAVSAVILYHAQITIFGHKPFTGGFIGVDIFFVISGYLITSIILQELVTTGSFSFKHFYERRIRRIFPALLLAMLASFPFAWMYLMPNDFVSYVNSIITSLSFNSNFFYHFSANEFDEIAYLNKPFFHTWSLSILGQYYALFPIILIVTFKHFRKYIIHILILGFIISLGLADWGSRNYPSATFFFLHTRIWELVAGSILAILETKQGYRSNNKLLNSILPSLGILLIFYSIIFFYDGMLHPSIRTIISVIGVSLIIWFANKDEFVSKILSSKVFVGTGLISYSLYMWHFPVFAFKRERSLLSLDNQDKFELILTCIILSIISYFLIEKNFRNKKIISKKIFWYITIFLSSIIILLSTIVIKKKGFINRITDKQLVELFDIAPRLKLRDDSGFCFDRNDNFCSFGNTENKKIYIVGDSTIAGFAHLLKDELIKKDYNYVTLIQSGCYYLPGFNRIQKSNGEINKDCSNDFHYKIRKLLNNNQDNIVIIGGNLNLYLKNTFVSEINGTKNWWNKFKPIDPNKNIKTTIIDSINELLNNSVKVILIYPIPELDFDLQKKLFLQIQNFKLKNKVTLFYKYLSENPITFDIQKDKERSKESYDVLNKIEHPNLYKIYPKDLLCSNVINNKCSIYKDKKFLYYDEMHLGEEGAKIISSSILEKVDQISNIKL